MLCFLCLVYLFISADWRFTNDELTVLIAKFSFADLKQLLLDFLYGLSCVFNHGSFRKRDKHKRLSIVTVTLTREEGVPIKGQNRYGLVTVGVNRREAARIFEINRYGALREGGSVKD